MKKIVSIALCVFSLLSCSDASKPDTTKLEIGMTKDQVIQAIGQPNSKYANGRNETFEYQYLEVCFDHTEKLVQFGLTCTIWTH